MMTAPNLIGKVYNIPPQPPVDAHNHVLPAGAITLGVEYREVDPTSLRDTYADNAAHLAELEERSPEGGFTDAGVSIHVCGSDDGFEYLRFDVFDDEPHYHYVHRADGGDVVNQVIDFDAVAYGEMLPWAIERLRMRLPEMLRAAGGAQVADRLDMQVVAPVIDKVAEMAERARAEHRAAQP
jgi:hypothetical protein